MSGWSCRVAVTRISQGETGLYKRKETRPLNPKEAEFPPDGCMAALQLDHRRPQTLHPNHSYSPVPHLPPRPPSQLTDRNSEKGEWFTTEEYKHRTRKHSRAGSAQTGREGQSFSFPLVLRNKQGDVVFRCPLLSPSPYGLARSPEPSLSEEK